MTITRRPRSQRQSTGAYITPKPADVWGTFRPLYEHGPLATNYVAEFRKWYLPNTTVNSASGRLGDLFHEENTEHGGPYLRRLAEHAKMPNYARFALYDVERAAEHALEENGYPYLTKRSFISEFDPHNFGVSCSIASAELAAHDIPGMTFESRNQLLHEAGNPLTIPCEITFNGKLKKSVEPDDIFGLGYNNKEYWRLFPYEFDMGTEDWNRLHFKFLGYQKVIPGGLYKTHFKRSCGMIVLFGFNNKSRTDGFLKRVEEWNGGPCTWIAAKTIPSFGKNLAIPDVMRSFLTEPWQRAGCPPLDISKP